MPLRPSEAIRSGGFGVELVSLLADACFDFLDAPPRQLGGLHTPMVYAQHIDRVVLSHAEDFIGKQAAALSGRPTRSAQFEKRTGLGNPPSRLIDRLN